jgi:hypothetical protein
MIEDEFYTDSKPASLSDWLLGLLAVVGIVAVAALLLFSGR